MNRTFVSITLALAASISQLLADPLLLDFGATPATSPYLSLSPGHVVGGVSGTTWNTISTSFTRSDLVFDNGASAVGLTLDLGQESTGGNGLIDFGTDIVNLALAGTGGGTAGQQVLVGDPGSIYGSGNIPANTAPGRDGFFGNGTSTGTGVAIGLRIDGLAVGDYIIYVMARNTNGNGAIAAPMNIFADTAPLSSTFNFAGLTPDVQANTNFNNSDPTVYNTFIDGQNYVALGVSIAEGESLYLAVDGANDAVERRGFLESVQIVPEPSSIGLLAVGLLSAGLRRKRKQGAVRA